MREFTTLGSKFLSGLLPASAGVVLHEAGKYKPAGYEFGSIPDEALTQDPAQLSPAAAAAFADALRGAGAWRHSHGEGAEAADKWYAAAERVCKGLVGGGAGAGGGAVGTAGRLLAQETLVNTCAAMVRTACTLASRCTRFTPRSACSVILPVHLPKQSERCHPFACVFVLFQGQLSLHSGELDAAERCDANTRASLPLACATRANLCLALS